MRYNKKYEGVDFDGPVEILTGNGWEPAHFVGFSLSGHAAVDKQEWTLIRKVYPGKIRNIPRAIEVVLYVYQSLEGEFVTTVSSSDYGTLVAKKTIVIEEGEGI